MAIKVIGRNLDTIELGYYGNVYETSLEILELKKNWKTNKANDDEFQEDNDSNIINFGGLDFLVYPTGVSKYKYLITNDMFTITINERGKGDPYPNVRVKVSSFVLWQKEDWHQALQKVLEEILEVEREIVSRVDIAVDFIGRDMVISDMEDVISRSRKRNVWFDTKELESIYFGSSNAFIKLRIYNKSKEILQHNSQKKWFFDLWEESGFKNEVEKNNVWRVEFQLRRKALIEWGVGNYKSFLTALADIYKYLTHDWAKFCDVNESNISRSEVREWWAVIQGVDFGSRSYIKRERTRKVNVKALKASAVGFIASLQAYYDRYSNIFDLDYTMQVIRREIEELGSEYALKIRQRKVMYQSI